MAYETLERGLKKIEYGILPEHMREAARLYIEHGESPGRLLTAAICNDLRKSFARADYINRPRLFDIVRFFHSQAPAVCWGSVKRMKSWQERDGFLGWIEKERLEDEKTKTSTEGS